MSAVALEPSKQERARYMMEPKKFVMWTFLVTVTMLFAGLTSAIVVRKADGNWMNFHVPAMFTLSTILIVLSSASLQYAYFSVGKNEIANSKLMLLITLILGIAFGFSQFLGYKELVHEGIYLVGNPSGSFFYVVTGLHLIHVIGGILFALAVLIQTYRFKVHSKNMLPINLLATYWHFIGGLWVYLFIILNVLR